MQDLIISQCSTRKQADLVHVSIPKNSLLPLFCIDNRGGANLIWPRVGLVTRNSSITRALDRLQVPI
jgi:hypothetical protein